MSRDRESSNHLRGRLVGPSNLNISVEVISQCRTRRQGTRFIESTLVLILLNVIIYSQMNLMPITADDSAAAPAFDMGTLASLASNLGSNPQIMSLVSSFLNPNGGQQKPGVGSSSGPGSSIQSDLGSVSDIETNSITNNGLEKVEPLRRGARVSTDQQAQATTGVAPTSAASSTPSTNSPSSPATASSSQPTPPPSANPLGGLMSMLPSMLSGLGGSSSGSLNLGGLSSLLGLNKPAQTSGSTAAATRSSDSDASQTSTAPTNAVASSSAVPAQQPQTAGPASASNQPVTAQQVINLVLTAYASGQIPNELIQLGLSGRVPPAIIELALSGQVPLEIIRMVITGQVPIPTINAFLGAMQQAQQTQQSQQAVGGASASVGAKPSSPGVFTATRNLFEALFSLARPKDSNHPESNKSGITVPTLIGPIPLKMPSLPNMRSIGQLVGGTITNFSSMIPF